MRRWLLYVGMAALVLIGGVSAAAVAGSLAGNRRFAHRDARGLLGTLRLPAGAQRVAREPAADGRWLRPTPGLVASSAQATAHEWWILPGSPADVLGYIESHPPRGARVYSRGSGGNSFTGQTFDALTYAWPRISGVIDLRELEVIVTAVSGDRTGVLAESDSVWLVPRSRGEKVPGRTREIDITVSAPRGIVVASYRVTGVRVGQIDHRLDALEVVQPYVTSCPAESPRGARVVTLEFRAGPGAPVLAQATFTAFAGWGTTSFQCNPISFSIAGSRQTPLLGGDFFGWLGGLLHTSFAAPRNGREAARLGREGGSASPGREGGGSVTRAGAHPGTRSDHSRDAGVPAADPARGCLAPRLTGLTLRRARDRVARAGCRLRVRGARVQFAAVQTVARQTPRAGRATTVTVWVNPPCSRSALSGPPDGEPILTPGPTALVSGLFLEGGPEVIFSNRRCAFRPESPWAGTITVTDPATGAILSTRTLAAGRLATFPLAPATYSVTGTFAKATVNGAHIRATRTVIVHAHETVRQDLSVGVP